MRHAVFAAVLSSIIAGAAWAQTAGTGPAAGDEDGGFSVSAEALLWWFKDNPAPPLVTDGLFGQPGTKVLLGGDDLDTNPNPGFRLAAGYAFDRTWGMEGSFFYAPRARRAARSARRASPDRRTSGSRSSTRTSRRRASSRSRRPASSPAPRPKSFATGSWGPS